ncbi:ribonuclease P protein component [Thermovirga lienii DSM 17291]|jgi:ribonuclease P protein component|uniref:Ribonuclease P protein component n=1 Tax=Thermovirga lienii (strain ATCC BAA-1197 / DSM 17291 / Cas60314) TaxID=580340 RepID=G7V976_THELD|nr:ribonuclease P protein component [Thermovirga lienii]MDN5318449.1 ribonuclease protein component [Thermovirga sp.]AER66445.1 ribonuclease P protein component [Thermovirga lienii DSM 17291]KUK42656.1 MAG: Ribonuclease P protein component [Thermovirga lienii]MDN5368129.1 ribonuclease protein component [Thermovirga sp.]HCD72431.1 ribonuclease P protein component [Thermovirga lienii]
MGATRLGYPADIRLKKAWQYDLVFRTGRRRNGALVRLLFIETHEDKTLIGLAVGKRQGGAVTRNRGKRILKEAARRLYPMIKDGYWIVLSLQKRGLSAKSHEVYEDLKRLLSKEGLLKSGQQTIESGQ